jgi:hypothetical protein
MPVRTKQKSPTNQGNPAGFSRVVLETFPDLDIQGILRMLDLDEFNEKFDRNKAIDRILQEQVHGFTNVLNQDVLDQFLLKARDTQEAMQQVGAKPVLTGSKAKVTTVGSDEPADSSLLVEKSAIGSVTYSVKEVKNLGNYESLHLAASVTLPFKPTTDDVAAAKATLVIAKALCLDQLNADMTELGL